MNLYQIAAHMPDSMAENIFSALNHKQRRAMAGRYLPRKSTRLITLSPSVDIDPPRIIAAMAARKENLPVEELLRTYFLSKHREMLIAALDFANIEHINGITNNDLDAITKAPREDARRLVDHLLERGFSDEVVMLYLATIGHEHYLQLDAIRAVLTRWGAGDLLPEPQSEEPTAPSVAVAPETTTDAATESAPAPPPAEDTPPQE